MKYLRRFMFFIAQKLVIITLCASLIIYAFYLAYNLGNAYILVSEGMEKRVDVCLTREDYQALNNYFSAGFLSADPVLAAAWTEASPYFFYDISSYEYDISISRLRWSPRSSTVTCVATERVTGIGGKVKAEFASQAAPDIVPWKSTRYTVTLHKQSSGKWLITGLSQDVNYKDTES